MLFLTSCSPCHGTTGAGDGSAAAALNPKPRDFTREPMKNGDKPEQIFATLTNGLSNTTMASFGFLSEEERWALSYYVLDLRRVGAGSAKKVEPVVPGPKK